jgi:aryl-alcohol dehydrogenase-like predicted oxidoreductase
MTKLGTSDLDVFGLCLGGNVFGWTADEAATTAVLDAYVAAGGNFVDTADSYSAWIDGHRGGESETLIGRWLAGRDDRDALVIATKVARHPEFQGLAADTIRRAADASLQRLQTDRIDLYYAHFDDPDTPLEETMGAFDELVRAGKVRAVGLSNYAPDRLRAALEICDEQGFAKPVAHQPEYSLVAREYETTTRPVCEAHGLACVPYYALASGFLTGKYRPGEDAGDSPRAGRARKHLESDRGQRVLAALDEIAAQRRAPHAAIAIAWLRDRPTVAAPIASARSVEQLHDLLAAADIVLNEDERDALDAASAVELSAEEPRAGGR